MAETLETPSLRSGSWGHRGTRSHQTLGNTHGCDRAAFPCSNNMPFGALMLSNSNGLRGPSLPSNNSVPANPADPCMQCRRRRSALMAAFGQATLLPPAKTPNARWYCLQMACYDKPASLSRSNDVASVAVIVDLSWCSAAECLAVKMRDR